MAKLFKIHESVYINYCSLKILGQEILCLNPFLVTSFLFAFKAVISHHLKRCLGWNFSRFNHTDFDRILLLPSRLV